MEVLHVRLKVIRTVFRRSHPFLVVIGVQELLPVPVGNGFPPSLHILVVIPAVLVRCHHMPKFMWEYPRGIRTVLHGVHAAEHKRIALIVIAHIRPVCRHFHAVWRFQSGVVQVEIHLVVIPVPEQRIDRFCGRIHGKPVHVDLPARFEMLCIFGEKRLIDAGTVLAGVAPVELEMLGFPCVDAGHVNVRIACGKCRFSGGNAA